MRQLRLSLMDDGIDWILGSARWLMTRKVRMQPPTRTGSSFSIHLLARVIYSCTSLGSGLKMYHTLRPLLREISLCRIDSKIIYNNIKSGACLPAPYPPLDKLDTRERRSGSTTTSSDVRWYLVSNWTDGDLDLRWLRVRHVLKPYELLFGKPFPNTAQLTERNTAQFNTLQRW